MKENIKARQIKVMSRIAGLGVEGKRFRCQPTSLVCADPRSELQEEDPIQIIKASPVHVLCVCGTWAGTVQHPDNPEVFLK